LLPLYNNDNSLFFTIPNRNFFVKNNLCLVEEIFLLIILIPSEKNQMQSLRLNPPNPKPTPQKNPLLAGWRIVAFKARTNTNPI
jgi:hypothetical protein